jgi:nitronate monooxygenase
MPILLAGMGGVSRWELAAAVAHAGGHPTLGMVREAPDLIEAEVRALPRCNPPALRGQP